MSSRGVYRSAQGLLVNMDNLRLLHEQEKAVGNMDVNARGDQVAKNGQVIKNKNQVIKDHYRQSDAIAQHHARKIQGRK